MKILWCLPALMSSSVASAAVSYSYVSGRQSAGTGFVTLPLYLREGITGGSASVIGAEGGLFGFGVRVSVSAGGEAARVASLVADRSSFPDGGGAEVADGEASLTAANFFAAQGVVPNGRGLVHLGDLRVENTGAGAGPAVVKIRRYSADGGNTLTFLGSDLDGDSSVFAGVGGISSVVVNVSGVKRALLLNSLPSVGNAFFDAGATSLVIRGSSEGAVRGLVGLWWNGGSPTEVGLGSSMVEGATMLAVVPNDNLLGGPAYGSVDGTATIAGDVVVKYTYMGDANIDGKVDAADLVAVELGLSDQSLKGWRNGDFNYDGVVDLADLGLWEFGRSHQGVALGGVAGMSNSVPETDAGLLAVFATAAGLARRQRR